MQRHGMSNTVKQLQSITYYTNVPFEMTQKMRLSAVYQLGTQATQPYNASLKQALVQDKKCLARWQTIESANALSPRQTELGVWLLPGQDT